MTDRGLHPDVLFEQFRILPSGNDERFFRGKDAETERKPGHPEVASKVMLRKPGCSARLRLPSIREWAARYRQILAAGHDLKPHAVTSHLLAGQLPHSLPLDAGPSLHTR